MTDERINKTTEALTRLMGGLDTRTIDLLREALRISDVNIDLVVEGDVEGTLNVAGQIINIAVNRVGMPPDIARSLRQALKKAGRGTMLQTNSTIFVSYSHADAGFARDLYQKLDALGFTMWRDRSEMEGGKDWWQQTQEAIEGADTMVLVLSPEALESPTVTKEWRYARQVGTHVIPVIAKEVNFDRVSHWMKKVDWLDFRRGAPEHGLIWNKFVNQLNSPYTLARVPFGAPDLPKGFVQRPEEFGALVSLLLSKDQENPVAITTALQGGGGFGKTVLAAALCHDPDVQSAFSDGILWVTLGEAPTEPRLLGLVSDQIELITGTRPGFSDLAAAGAAFKEALGAREMLIVLDDVWREGDARPFMQGGPRCARLVTTRRADIAAGLGAKGVAVDEMTPDQAVKLLVDWMAEPPSHLRPFEELAEELGRWPLMLELAGAWLREAMVVDREPLDAALTGLWKRLEKRGFAAFDRADEGQRNKAISLSLEVSLERLGKWRERYLELAIFPAGMEIPFSAVEKFFGGSAGLDELDVEDALKAMNRLSLFNAYDGGRRALGLHDVIRGYAGRQLDDPARLHAALVAAWGDPHALPDDYAWRWVGYHLMQAGQGERLRGLLLDYGWLAAKLARTGAGALIADADRLPEDEEMRLLTGALRLSAHVLAEDKGQLWLQLHGRLCGLGRPVFEAMLTKPPPGQRLRPVRPNLTPPGGPLIRTLGGHSDKVFAVAMSADGRRAISASEGGTLKVWDVDSGAEERTLAGHVEDVWKVMLSADGQRAVSLAGGTLKVWNLETGVEEQTLIDHASEIWAHALSGDGRWVVSGSYDGALRVWSCETGAQEQTLEAGWVLAVALSADGRRAVSGSKGGTLKVWNLEAGAEERTLAGHADDVWEVAMSADGRRAVSWSDDRTLKVWNLETGSEERTLAGSGVRAVAVDADGRRVVCGLYDGTLQVWNIETGTEEWRFAGHAREALAVAVSADGRRAISGSTDGMLKVWNLETGTDEQTLRGHKFGRVQAVALTANGRRAVSVGSGDWTLRLWNAETGAEEKTLAAHTAMVWAVSLSADGREAISGSTDGNLRVWDLDTGTERRMLAGHTGSVYAVALSADGQRAVSGSSDGTLKVWNLETGAEEKTLTGHTREVLAVALSADGRRAVSGSPDGTLKVWNLETGTEEQTLDGHRDMGRAVALSADGRRAVSGSSDGTLKVWNLETGAEEKILTGHTREVLAVALSADGRRAVSGSEDNTLRVSHVQTGMTLAVFRAESAIWTCAMSADGKLIACGEVSGRVHFLQYEA